ncbi:MAG: methionine/alanine import family NSS transporter small subunit [Intrasporangiaceae bacterium]|nr:methionine/alanine import family NSS transporter small subunit [Intrasporangiaceae bacterium]
MTTSAIIMMLIAILVVWGGLAVAIVLLARSDAAGDPSIHRDL